MSNDNVFKLQEPTFKAPITTTIDDSLEYFFHCFSEKIRLYVHFNSISVISGGRADDRETAMEPFTIEKISHPAGRRNSRPLDQ